MSCEKFELELLDSFGSNSLSTELKEHIPLCVSCNEIFENLQSAASEIGTDELFYESDEIVAKRVEAVNRKIDSIELTKVIDIKHRWKSYVPMAAALILVLGIGLISKYIFQFNSADQAINTTDTEVLFVSLTKDDTKSLTELEFSEFVDQYSTEFGLENEMQLLEDISEEEYKYLEENLKIGEIL